MTTTSDTVLAEVSEGVATVTLNKPEKLNAFDYLMAEELVSVLEKVAADPGARCVVVTGAGRGFCAGGEDPFAPALQVLGHRAFLGRLQQLELAHAGLDHQAPGAQQPRRILAHPLGAQEIAEGIGGGGAVAHGKLCPVYALEPFDFAQDRHCGLLEVSATDGHRLAQIALKHVRWHIHFSFKCLQPM